MMIFRILPVTIFLIGLVLSSFAEAQTFGSLASRDLKELLRYYVANNSDLKTIWDYQHKTQEKDIYLVGSSLRGMLSDIQQKASKGMSVQQIKDSCCRSISDYLPKDGSGDIDIIFPDQLVSRTWGSKGPVATPEGLNLDALTLTFQKLSTALGGASIQSLAVNPMVVLDPDHTIEAVINGLLSIKPISEETYLKIKKRIGRSDFVSDEFTVLGLLLRIARYHFEMPYLKLDPNFKNMLSMLKYETHGREGTRVEEKTKKFLLKRFENDPIQYFAYMKKIGLVTALGEYMYRISPYSFFDRPWQRGAKLDRNMDKRLRSLSFILGELKRIGFTFEELTLFAKSSASGYIKDEHSLKEAMQFLAREIRTPAERDFFLSTYDPKDIRHLNPKVVQNFLESFNVNKVNICLGFYRD